MSLRRYLLLEQSLGPGLFNLVLNGVIAWLMFRGTPTVPFWGEQSIAGDTIGTSFILPVLTCLIVTPLARGHVRAGRVAPFEPTATVRRLLPRLPRGTLARGVALGALCAVTAAPLMLAVLAGLQVAALGFAPFIVFKALYAAGLAAVVTPLIAMAAIGASAPPPS